MKVETNVLLRNYILTVYTVYIQIICTCKYVFLIWPNIYVAHVYQKVF